jgi:hypothetical protein
LQIGRSLQMEIEIEIARGICVTSGRGSSVQITFGPWEGRGFGRRSSPARSSCRLAAEPRFRAHHHGEDVSSPIEPSGDTVPGCRPAGKRTAGDGTPMVLRWLSWMRPYADGRRLVQLPSRTDKDLRSAIPRLFPEVGCSHRSFSCPLIRHSRQSSSWICCVHACLHAYMQPSRASHVTS